MLRPFCPGPPGWAGARRELLNFMVQGNTNRGRPTDHPSGRNSIRTNQCPPPPTPKFFYRPDVLPAAQPTVSKHWRQYFVNCYIFILYCNILQVLQSMDFETVVQGPPGIHGRLPVGPWTSWENIFKMPLQRSNLLAHVFHYLFLPVSYWWQSQISSLLVVRHYLFCTKEN